MNRDEQLNEFFKKIVELYQLSPEMAAALLRRILNTLSGYQGKDEPP